MIYVYMLILDDKRREESAVGKRVFFLNVNYHNHRRSNIHTVCVPNKN